MPVGRFADHLYPVGEVEDQAEPGADELLVVGEKDADHASGNVTRSAKPSRSRTGDELATEERDAFPQAREPAAAAATAPLAGAVVVDLDADGVGAVPKHDLDPAGRGVLADVRQPLLKHPVGSEIERRRERHRLTLDP